MAEERSFQQGRQERRHENLDEQLSAYYGPSLPEQPLPASSWQRLHMQLGSQQRPRRSLTFPRMHRLRLNRRAVPLYIHETFLRIAFDARVPVSRTMLHCSLKAQSNSPAVRVSSFGRGQIKLTLPLEAVASMDPPMLDVLLASGLARLHYARRASHIVANLLLLTIILLGGLCLMLLWLRQFPLPGLLIAVVLWAFAGVLLHLHERWLALRADALMVQWLGRGRACQGLHMLADRSRSTRLIRWGEPSLEERIARVCGTQVPVADERLTLVR